MISDEEEVSDLGAAAVEGNVGSYSPSREKLLPRNGCSREGANVLIQREKDALFRERRKNA